MNSPTFLGEIRFARKFVGTKKIYKEETVMQQAINNPHYFGSVGEEFIWQDVPTVWAYEEDAIKAKLAKDYESTHSPR